MNWDDSRLLDQICYDLILGDYPRGINRKMIADQANGVQPYTKEEEQENQINVNINDLSMTRALQEARGQFSNAFLKPGNFFAAKTDMGAVHKRSGYSATVTKEINKRMKGSIPYYEYNRSKFGLLALHGISPGVWENEYRWRPKSLGVEDALVPSGTLLGFENLPVFVLRRSFTAMELQKLTAKEKRDPGWQMPLVERALKWADDQTTLLMAGNWPESWAPEKWAERKKEGGFYASDQVPTIDCFDIYGYDDSANHEGWVRRIILDSWGTPSQSGVGYTMARDSNKKDLTVGKSNDFLFTSKTRKIAASWQNIIAFQFADLSAVAPFRYHSVRSLGYLLYAVCHLQNRLHCKFNEAVFESLMMLFRVKSMDDVQRALKLDMVNKGFIDDSITPVPAQDRWQPNAGLIELGLQLNQGQISASTGAYAQRRDFSQDKVEKTRFQVMAEVNADTALVSSALGQAYQYQKFEDEEIFRRFMLENSKDPDVISFRAAVLRKGVPEKILVPEAWEVEHERVMGGGNKTQELQIVQQLMEWRGLLDPEPQRIVLRDAITAITDDAARGKELVPEKPVKVTDSVHDAQLATASLLAGLPVSMKTGVNHIEIVETLLSNFALLLKKAEAKKGMVTMDQIQGFQNLAQHIAQHIGIIAQDKQETERVKQYKKALSDMMNKVKEMFAKLQAAMKAAAQNGDGQMDPKDKAKIAAIKTQAAVKAKNADESHADKTAQRRITFEQKTRQDQEKHQMQMQEEAARAELEMRKEAAKTAQELHHTRLKHLSEGSDEE